MILQESGEMYLETILQLQQKKDKVRAIDVAEEMNFTKASVSRAMSILKRENFILVEAGGNIVLTEAGLAKAKAVLERHKVLTRCLVEARRPLRLSKNIWRTANNRIPNYNGRILKPFCLGQKGFFINF